MSAHASPGIHSIIALQRSAFRASVQACLPPRLHESIVHPCDQVVASSLSAGMLGGERSRSSLSLHRKGPRLCRRHSALSRVSYSKAQPYVPRRLCDSAISRTKSLLHSLWYRDVYTQLPSRGYFTVRAESRKSHSAPRARHPPRFLAFYAILQNPCVTLSLSRCSDMAKAYSRQRPCARTSRVVRAPWRARVSMPRFAHATPHNVPHVYTRKIYCCVSQALSRATV